MLPSRKRLFGIIDSMPSALRIVEARMPISVIRPRMPSTSTRSPSRSGRSISSITPDTRFFSRVCRPKPAAIASAPPRNANAVSGMLALTRATRPRIAATTNRIHLRTSAAACGVARPGGDGRALDATHDEAAEPVADEDDERRAEGLADGDAARDRELAAFGRLEANRRSRTVRSSTGLARASPTRRQLVT